MTRESYDRNSGGNPTLAGRRLNLDKSTSLIGNDDGSGYRVERARKDGTRVVAGWRSLPDGSREFDAYRTKIDKKSGTETQVFFDGRKIIKGRDFVTVTKPGHVAVTRFNSGLRIAKLANGKPVFKEEFGTSRSVGGIERSTVVRTIYTGVHRGRAWRLKVPVQETYALVPYEGTVLYSYQPEQEEPGFYEAFFGQFAAPLTLASVCADCNESNVEFNSGWFARGDSYDQPTNIVGDMMIAEDERDDGAGESDDIGPDDEADYADEPAVDMNQKDVDPEVTSLQGEVVDLQRKLKEQETRNVDLQGQLNEETDDNAVLQRKLTPDTKQPKSKLRVPSSLRDQYRDQVKEAIDAQKAQKPIAITDVIASAKAKKHVFLMSKPLEAKTQSGKCMLQRGDFAQFEKVPGAHDTTARMRVALSRQSSCAQDSVVDVNIADLQEVLNDFEKSLEVTMKKTHDKIAAIARKSAAPG